MYSFKKTMMSVICESESLALYNDRQMIVSTRMSVLRETCNYCCHDTVNTWRRWSRWSHGRWTHEWVTSHRIMKFETAMLIFDNIFYRTTMLRSFTFFDEKLSALVLRVPKLLQGSEKYRKGEK